MRCGVELIREVSMKTLSHGLADYASSLEYKDLPADVIHEVKRRLIDSLGCALSAYKSPPGQIAREIAGTVKSTYSATVLGGEDDTTPDLATFANGVLVRYLDYNDTYLSKEPAHPSDNIPAALSVAEAEKAHGKALTTAIVLGYEVQCRLCDAATLRAKGWDHVAYVSISSALVASKLMDLDRERMGNAISLSIAPNIALRQTRVGELSMWKGCAAANAARNGVFAALLARGGMTGPTNVFEGDKGFFNQVTGPFDLEIDAFGGGENLFKILDTYIKNYPSEYHSQAVVQACLELKKEVGVEDIEEIAIETYDAAVDIIAGDDSKWVPETRETADHSLPYCAAVALIDGRVGLGQFSDERIKDPELKKLISKVKVKRNPEHTRLYPEALPCLVEIRTRDGKRRSRTVTYPKGHPKNPLTDIEVEEKFEGLSGGLIKASRLKEIKDILWNLENLRNIRTLMRLFTVGA
jgi:2-methylcitrate dehydratase